MIKLYQKVKNLLLKSVYKYILVQNGLEKQNFIETNGKTRDWFKL